MSRREFGRLAAGVGVLGLGGAAAACGGPSSAPEQTETATPVPDARTQPISLTQADLDQIIGNHANTLLNNLQSKTPGVNYGVAVTFAYPNHQFNPYYMYGTVGGQAPPTPRTLFAIGSITKTFTTAMFANGVVTNPGCFDWDAGLSRYLDGYLGATGNLSQTMQQITPRMLAQHTSGLPTPSGSSQDGVGLFETNPSAPPPDLLNFWQTHNGPQPGSCWRYSDMGFITLGFTTASAYGCAAGGNPPPAQAYSALLQSQITGPLNMPDTVTIVPNGVPLAPAYPNGGPEVSSGGASDIKSSATDMHTWLLAHLGAANGSSPLMQALASTTQPSPLSVNQCGESRPGPANMGLAWQVAPGPPRVIWKDGLTSLGGCSCWIGMTMASPTQEPLGIAVLLNGYWNKGQPNVIADNAGMQMLKEISAAI
ncbi:MAG: serine hydrolase domain-containing protein, partial [Mycobacterium sp.]